MHTFAVMAGQYVPNCGTRIQVVPPKKPTFSQDFLGTSRFPVALVLKWCQKRAKKCAFSGPWFTLPKAVPSGEKWSSPLGMWKKHPEVQMILLFKEFKQCVIVHFFYQGLYTICRLWDLVLICSNHGQSSKRCKQKSKDRITPQVNFFKKTETNIPVGRGRKGQRRRCVDRLVKRLYVKSCVWQSCASKIACDKVVCVCERWCVIMLRVKKWLCVCVANMVCNKDVCERWCVTEMCLENVVWQRCTWKMVCVCVCDKNVCDRWCVWQRCVWKMVLCVTKMCVKDGVWQRCV